jgi:hypothetical protein
MRMIITYNTTPTPIPSQLLIPPLTTVTFSKLTHFTPHSNADDTENPVPLLVTISPPLSSLSNCLDLNSGISIDDIFHSTTDSFREDVPCRSHSNLMARPQLRSLPFSFVSNTVATATLAWRGEILFGTGELPFILSHGHRKRSRSSRRGGSRSKRSRDSRESRSSRGRRRGSRRGFQSIFCPYLCPISSSSCCCPCSSILLLWLLGATRDARTIPSRPRNPGGSGSRGGFILFSLLLLLLMFRLQKQSLLSSLFH